MSADPILDHIQEAVNAFNKDNDLEPDMVLHGMILALLYDAETGTKHFRALAGGDVRTWDAFGLVDQFQTELRAEVSDNHIERLKRQKDGE